MPHALICDAGRTPVGRYGGALAAMRADDMAAATLRGLIDRHPQLDAEAIDDVILGCANQAGEDNRNVARMAALLAGLPVGVSGTTMNRWCALGLDAIGTAARAIRAGDADLLVAGGVESMTRAPFVLGKADTAFSRGAHIEDTTIGWRFVNPAMRERYGVDSMPETAENVVREFGVSRADQDALALRSQQRWAAAEARGFFARERIALEIPQRKGELRRFETDEHPRPQTTMETLSRLAPVVHREGTVTAGNASGVNDGAAALLLASDAAVQRFGLVPRARVLGMAAAGVPPRVMGVGPVPAVRTLLARSGHRLAQIDAIEVNEAFAAQVLAVTRELGLADDAAHVNPNGGAIAIGHPLGASGGRLVATLLCQLEATGARLGVASMRVGVGQGLALLIERL
jgi:3-oxoadipyl-CoA thiolase